uniref:Uncharacterized protein n=1 Tax=Lygus hesperus TaxID=30085 RepID=A0A0A9XF05_LYGHE
MSGKGWTPGGNVEEWSVHAQLSFTPQAGNIVLTANEGPSRDSGYSSEHMSPRGVVGARATCSVTVAGHHTVTLTCSEIPEQVTNPGNTLVPQTLHFCHHPPPEKPHRHFHPHPTPPTPATPSQQAPTGPASPQQVPSGPPTPQQESLPPLPVLKDAASQTSSTNVPQVLQEHTKKRKSRLYGRSPARSKGSPIGSKTAGSSGESDGKKNPRTVHIDVYCTGSESDGSSSSEEEDTNSTPQTVFESSKVKVMHARAHSDSLPHALQRQKRRVLSNSRLDMIPKDGSGSTISTSYPSPRSSLVSNTTGGFSLGSESTISSRISSVNNSSVTTSWKDTDLESTQASLLKSDSFDYENSFDKLRIREKEKAWGSVDRPKRFYKRAAPTNSNSSDSTDEEEEGLAWSFGRYEDIQKRHLKREETVRYQSQTSEAPSKPHSPKQTCMIKQVPSSLRKSGSLSDSEASNIKKLKNGNPTGRPPPAYPFQHWAKAERFGPMVSSLKKPGHHVGPSKNPDCSCDTCRYFFEHICYRNRTRSLGDRSPS